MRITGQLVDAATGAHLWADRFDGTLEGCLRSAGPGDCERGRGNPAGSATGRETCDARHTNLQPRPGSA